MSDAIITVENLGKRYQLGAARSNERYTALRDVVTNSFSAPFRRLRNRRSLRTEAGRPENGSLSQTPISHLPSAPASQDFWALKNVSFEVKQGEVLGIIGRNGAGKSTLLKILSRITEPTEGRIKIKGRVASLLEVGTGFHPELTGRENIYLNGAILGMPRSEIKTKFDEIVAFAETERFLDTPVKRYSSGMYVRLAFAVAAHLEPEILVVDEVLAVGDAEFQKKCLGKMQEVGKSGRTVLFVSHQLGTIRQLCQRVLLLRAGRIAQDDLPAIVIENYLSQSIDGVQGGCFVRGIARPEGSVFFVHRVTLSDSLTGEARRDFECDESVVIRAEYKAERAVAGLYGYVTLQRSDGTLIYEGDSFDVTHNPLESQGEGEGQLNVVIPPRLLGVGSYFVYLNFSATTDKAGPNIDSPGIVGEFSLSDNGSRRGNRRQGFLSVQLEWRLSSATKRSQLS